MPANLDDPMAKVFRGTMQSVIKVRSRSNLSERLNSTLQSNIEKQMMSLLSLYQNGNNL